MVVTRRLRHAGGPVCEMPFYYIFHVYPSSPMLVSREVIHASDAAPPRRYMCILTFLLRDSMSTCCGVGHRV